jgi:ribosome hibernation promoting factor
MKIQVRSRQVEVDGTARAHVERRLQFGLGRLSLRILRVTVQIVDLNGPRGGEDKSCRIEVRLLPTGRVFVEDTDADLYAAIDRAVDRVARSVLRAIKRSRAVTRGPCRRATREAGPKARSRHEREGESHEVSSL